MPGSIERGDLHPELRARLPGDPHDATGSHTIRPAAGTIGGHRQTCYADLVIVSVQVVLNTKGGLFGPSIFTLTCDPNRSEYFLTTNDETPTAGIQSDGDLGADR